MICKNCKNDMEPGSSFCRKCGTPVKNKGKGSGYIALIIAVVVMAIGAILLIVNNGTDAYEKQMDIGYDLLNKGDYEEAVIAFDKAIKIDEKRPEGYMGKAEALAYDTDMTPEKAGEIVRVLEEGYKKSGDKAVLDHKMVVGEIIRNNGFEAEADIVENIEVDDPKTGANSDSGAFFESAEILKKNGCTYFVSGGKFYKTDENGARTLLYSGNISVFATDGKTAYMIDKNSQNFIRVDCETAESTDLGKVPGEVEMAINFAFDNYIFVAPWSNFEDGSVKIFNTETESFEDFKSDDRASYVKPSGGKIYYTTPLKEIGEITTLYEANPDGSDSRVITESLVSACFDIVDGEIYYAAAKDKSARSINTSGMEIRKYNISSGADDLVKSIDYGKDAYVEINKIGYGFGEVDLTDYEGTGTYEIYLFNGTEKRGNGRMFAGRGFFAMTPNTLGEDSHHDLLFEDREEQCDIRPGSFLLDYIDKKAYYMVYDSRSNDLEPTIEWTETY